MKELDLEIVDWLGTTVGDPVEAATLASFRITAGDIPITEVQDTIARTVRTHIYVPAYPIACWLLMNWWRLRWEPRPNKDSYDWICAHSMAAISSDYAWPAVQFSSDGEFVEVQLSAEPSPDVSAIRYLRNVRVSVAAAHFEAAVERFLDNVEARLAECVPDERDLRELRGELRDERSDSDLTRACKLQALAGIDPGSASDEWLSSVEALSTTAGPAAMDEIMAAVPRLTNGLAAAEQAVSAMRKSPTTIKLDWATLPPSPAPPRELPWERGARRAGELRRHLGIPSGPLETKDLADLLDAKLPLAPSIWTGEKALRGGFRDGVQGKRTALLVMKSREDSQRFYLSRLIAAALASSPEQHVLPVSEAGTAFQKFERSFAQEFLCPWADLDAFTDEHGVDDEGIEEAAEYFNVSTWMVRRTLVNRRKLLRYALEDVGGPG